MLDHGLFKERNYRFKARNLSCFDTESDIRGKAANEEKMRKATM